MSNSVLYFKKQMEVHVATEVKKKLVDCRSQEPKKKPHYLGIIASWVGDEQCWRTKTDMSNS